MKWPSQRPLFEYPVPSNNVVYLLRRRQEGNGYGDQVQNIELQFECAIFNLSTVERQGMNWRACVPLLAVKALLARNHRQIGL